MIYEMVAGHAPFAGPSIGDVLGAILKEEPPSLTPAAPEALEQITRKAIAKDLSQRYGSAKDLELDLKRLRQELDLQARLDVIAQPRAAVMNRRKAIWLAGTAAAAALSGLAAWRVWPHSTGIRSLAVLPFLNEANDEDADWLSTGICDSLIRQIQQLNSLQVMAFSTVMNFKGKTIEPREAGRVLGVPAIVTGRVALRNNRVTIFAELVDVASGVRLWGNTYERPMSDILSIQDEIAQAIVNEGIRLKLSTDERRVLGRHITDDPEPYELFQRGVRQADLESEEGYLKARELLKQAIKRDPKFAVAYIALGGTYTASATDGYEPPAEAWRRQKEFIQKAAELDPTQPGIHLEAGARAFSFEWDWAGAEREFALTINSDRQDLVEPRFFAPYALERWALGHAEDSLRLTRQARKIDPLGNVLKIREAHYLRWSGQLDTAIDLYRAVIHDDPAEDRAYPGLSDSFAAQGAFDDALDVLRQWVRIASNSPYQDKLGNLLEKARGAEGYRQVQRALARVELDEVTERGANGDYVSPVDLARTYARLGDKNMAFHYLDAAFVERSPGLAFLNVDPVWDALRDNSRFRAAVSNLRLPER